MALRRFIVFTVLLLMLAAAPVWGNTGAIPDQLRIDESVNGGPLVTQIDGMDPIDTTWPGSDEL